MTKQLKTYLDRALLELMAEEREAGNLRLVLRTAEATGGIRALTLLRDTLWLTTSRRED